MAEAEEQPTSATTTEGEGGGKDLILTIDSIFVGRDFRAESFSQPRWWASGSCYTALVKTGTGRPDNGASGGDGDGGVASSKLNGGGGGGDDAEKSASSGAAPSTRDLVWHDVATNTTKTYVSSDLLIPPGHDAPLAVDDYALSPDKSRLLVSYAIVRASFLRHLYAISIADRRSPAFVSYLVFQDIHQLAQSMAQENARRLLGAGHHRQGSAATRGVDQQAVEFDVCDVLSVR